MCVLFLFRVKRVINMNEKYIKIAIQEAFQAKKEGEIPVGAVIVQNGEIIAQAHNMKEQTNCTIKHAEIICIEQANKKLKDWRLNNCEMYVTMEPCIMCCGALIQARIKKVYYLLENKKFGGLGNISLILDNEKNNHVVEYEKINVENLENVMKNELKEIFLNKR